MTWTSSAVEGWAASEIRQEFGGVRDFVNSSRVFGCYTENADVERKIV